MRQRIVGWLGAALVAVLAGACIEDIVPPENVPGVVDVEVAPGSLRLLVGDTARLAVKVTPPETSSAASPSPGSAAVRRRPR
jgi:hypothetical protein